MKKISLLLAIAVVGAFMLACGESAQKQEYGEVVYEPQYATGFTILRHDSSSILRITNPWQGAKDVVMELFISRNGEQPPKGFTGSVVSAPAKRIVCMSSSYVAFIEAIGSVESVVGISGVGFITSDSVRSRSERGLVRDIGYDTNLNYEMIASLKPDVVMLYGVLGEESALTDKLRELDIQTIYIGDYTEYSPLGKAEWIVAISEMFDKRDRAMEIFTGVEKSYQELQAMVEQKVTDRPNIMLNAPWRDSWFVPGDRSYIVQLINDAGGEYACKGVDSHTSRAISGESAYVIASQADIWMNPNQFHTLGELLSENPKFADIKAVKNRQVYNNNKKNTHSGGSDFWESGAVYPNLILEDMIHILHPELSAIEQTRYFKKLE